jgi:hypothetical protein
MSGPRLAATKPGEAAMAPSPRILRLSRYPTRTALAAPGRLWSRAQPPAAPRGLLMRSGGSVTQPRQQRAAGLRPPRARTPGSPWATARSGPNRLTRSHKRPPPAQEE